MRGLRERRFDVIRIAGFGFERQIAGNIVVQLRCAGGERFLGPHHARQVTVVDFDKFGRILRGGSAVRDHQRDCLADEAHFAVREHRAFRRTCFRAVAPGYHERMRRVGVTRGDRIGAGENVLYAGMRERGCRVQAGNLGVRAVRA